MLNQNQYRSLPTPSPPLSAVVFDSPAPRPYNRTTMNKAHIPLGFILVLFSLITLHQSITLPIGEAADETDHYQYLQFVAHHGHPPLTDKQRQEAGYKGGLAPLYYWIAAWPIAWVGPETPPHIRRTDQRPERHIPNDGLGFNRVMHTWDEQWPWQGQILAWHAVRLLSLPMAWVTLITIYCLARQIFPQRPSLALGAVIVTAFLPRFVISSAVVNDDNLVFALCALILWVQFRLIKGHPSPIMFGCLGGLLGLALMTKYFSLILLPEIMLTFWISLRAVSRPEPAEIESNQLNHSIYPHRKPRYFLQSTLYFLGFLLLTAGPWFTFIIYRFNRINELGWIAGLAASLGEPQITEGLVRLLSGDSPAPLSATVYPFHQWLWLLYRSFWFEYGWMNMFAPTWIYIGLGVLILMVWGTSGYGWPRYQQPSAIRMLFGLRLGLFVAVLLIRYRLSGTIDTGQGRHLYPALPVMAIGLAYLISHHPRKVVGRIIPSITYVALALYTLLPFHGDQQYPFLPVTSLSTERFNPRYTPNIATTAGLTFVGFDVPSQAEAGSTLPVTLHWQAEQEIGQDYWLSLCLENQSEQPAACWQGHFADGRYPARAWEAGDRLIDTVELPIPACQQLAPHPYRLHLSVWPLALDSLTPQPHGSPLFEQRFSHPPINIKPTRPSSAQAHSPLAVWRGNKRLAGRISLNLNETLTIIQPAASQHPLSPLMVETTPSTALYLPCDAQTASLATAYHLTAHAGLTANDALFDNLPELTVSLNHRTRQFGPITNGPTFGSKLAPIALQVDQLTLNPTELPTKTVRLAWPLNQPLPLTIRWQAHQWMADPLIGSLKLLDKDFMVGAEKVARLGDRYPNVLWLPGEIVEESYILNPTATTSPGLYRLELSVLHQSEQTPARFEYLSLEGGPNRDETNLYPLTVRLLDPQHGQTPAMPLKARFGEQIQLQGYDWQRENESIMLALYWQNSAKLETDYTVFTQLLGPDGQLWAQWDNPPQAGRYATRAWLPDDRVVDRYRLSRREGAPDGDYRLLVGLYDPATGERLSAWVENQRQPDDALEVTRFFWPAASK